MVHVEIWAGDGEKTIGARWQKEKYVWHIDHYSFVFDNKKRKKNLSNFVGKECKSNVFIWSIFLIRVQIHESYQYVSKSYYNMVYHFKSIDTWLNGTCMR